MQKLSELISQGREIRLSNGKQKNIVMRMTKNGWVSQKDDMNNKVNKGSSRSVLLKEDPVRYVRRLYSLQYKITSPSNVQLDW